MKKFIDWIKFYSKIKIIVILKSQQIAKQTYGIYITIISQLKATFNLLFVAIVINLIKNCQNIKFTLVIVNRLL